MIKDILVNLSFRTSQDGVSNYALSVAETFGAHIMGTAFYPAVVGGVDLSANFIRAQQAEAQERAESVATAFDEAARRAGVSAETRRIETDVGDVPTQFAHIARRFDLSVIGQFERDRDHRTYSEGPPQTRSCHGVLGWQSGSRPSGRRCHAVSYPLRHDEYCCCGHSERQKRRPSRYGYRDPPDPSRSKRHD